MWRGRLAGTHGAPRALSLSSSPPPTPPGSALGCREGARTARCGSSCAARLSRRVRAGGAAGSACASEVGCPAGPLSRSFPRGSEACPQALALRHRGSASAVALRAPEPTRPSRVASDSGLTACGPGPRPRGRVSAYVREAKPRRRRGKKKSARGRKEKNFIFSPPGTEARGRQLRQRALPRELQGSPQLAEAHRSWAREARRRGQYVGPSGV